MSTRTELEAALLEDWKNKTRALVLADYLCEHCDLDRTAALRVVANLRRTQRDAEELARAAELMSADSPHRRDLLLVLLRYTDRECRALVTLVLVAGRKTPVARAVWETSSRGARWHTTLTYSAGWLLRKWKRLQHIRRGAAVYKQYRG